MDSNVNSIPNADQIPSQRIQQPNFNKNQKSDYLALLKYTHACEFIKTEIDLLLKLFKKFDIEKQGYLSYHNMIELLNGNSTQIQKEFGFQVNNYCKEKIFKEIEIRNTKLLDFQTLIYVSRVCQDCKSENKANLVNLQNMTLVDAFVALGGEPDASGFIHKNSIIDILKVEFDLQFDIDDFLNHLDLQNDQLDFDSFRNLFKSNNKDSMQRNSSLLSIFSQKSMKSTSSVSTVKIRMKDFEKFLKKMEQEDSEYLSQASPVKRI